MGVFTAIAAAIVSAIGITGTAATIFTAIGATLLSVGVSTLVAKRMQPSGRGLGAGQGGGRIQLPPATDNKIPVVYGSAFVGGPVIDAKLSTDQQYMWYVVALAEHTDTTAGSGYTFDTSNIYYDGKKVQFGSNGTVTGLINNTTPPTIDTKVNGKIKIWLFTNGSSSGVNTGGQTAIQILQDSTTGKGIPVGQRWTSTDTMTNCAFAIVRVEYNTDAGTTSLGALQCKITNTINKPGDAIKDYLLNTRYGCAVPLSRIDTVSLDALNTYSDELITYASGSTQVRYRINGPLATNVSCLENLQILVDSADSWLQYNELTAKWSVVINQSYTDYTTIDNLFLVDSSNLVGGINVSPINLNETFNQMEIAYPNQYIKDQIDYQLIELEDYQPGVLSPNEAVNKLDIDFPVINNSVQALYVGVRRLLQSREDLTVTFQLDYSGIQVEAGDVIRIKHDTYGWDVLNSGKGKLFRVASVAEEKYQDGSLGVAIIAFEYNDTVYSDRPLLDFQPDPNTGLEDPNIIDKPDAPIVQLKNDGPIAYLEITGTVPDTGLVTYLDFNYGINSNSELHLFYTSAFNANGAPLSGDLEASAIQAGTQYQIQTLGNTDYTTFGGTEVDLSNQPNIGSFLIPGQEYIITTQGNTAWTNSGASSNVVGTIFVANDTVLATGNGVAVATTFIANNNGSGNGTVQTSYTITMNDLPFGNYYWSVTAKNDQVGITSNSTGPIEWRGPDITNYNSNIICNVSGNTGNTTLTFASADDNVCLGGNVSMYSGVGSFAANTYITEIVSNTSIVLNTAPTANLNNSCIQITCLDPNTGNVGGGIDGNTIQDGTIGYDKIQPGLQVNEEIGGATWQIYTTSGGNIITTLPAAFAINEPSAILSSPAIDANLYFPFVQGTSSTANGYRANSILPLIPYGSHLLDITNGDNQWYINSLVDIEGGFRPVVDGLASQASFIVYSTSNCTVQFCPYAIFTGANTTLSLNTSIGITSHPIIENQATYIEFEDDFIGVGGDGRSLGYVWRILEGDADPNLAPVAVCITGGHKVSKFPT